MADFTHKCVKGRKRHLLVDTLGLPLSFSVTPANVHDTLGAHCLLAGLKYFVPRLKIIWADQAYQGHNLADWCRSTGDWTLEVVKRASGTRGRCRATSARGGTNPMPRWVDYVTIMVVVILLLSLLVMVLWGVFVPISIPPTP